MKNYLTISFHNKFTMALTYYDFEFRNISNNTRNDISYYFEDKYIINITQHDPVFNIFSPYYNHIPIEHNIVQIKNSAPTLQQFITELQVYSTDIDSNTNELSNSFFTNANDNFTVSTNARDSRFKKKMKPLYYYHIDETTCYPEKCDEHQRNKIFCDKYCEIILKNHSIQLKTFIMLQELCKNKSKDDKIMICGPSVDEEYICDMYEYYKNNVTFGVEYLMCELLIHYPHINKCCWNIQEDE